MRLGPAPHIGPIGAGAIALASLLAFVDLFVEPHIAFNHTD